MESAIVFGEMLTPFCLKLLSTKQTFFPGFLRDKIIFLISNMFIYAMVGNSKFVEMHVQCV